MKTTRIKTLLSMMIISMLLIGNLSFAQQGRGMGNKQGKKQNTQMNKPMNKQGNMYRIPDLTAEQKEQIKTIKTKMMKEMLPLRNLLKEKMAHLNTLSTTASVDMKAVNKQIEEIGKIKTDMMKVRAKYYQQIRAILTDDQRVFFDMHAPKMMKQGMKGHGKNKGNCRY